MSQKRYLGEFEQMVLAAALRLEGEAYGASIIRAISRETGRRVPTGTISVTLDRLEAKKYLKSRMGDPNPERGGRPKRYVTVTRAGRQAMAESRAALMNLWSGLEAQLEDR